MGLNPPSGGTVRCGRPVVAAVGHDWSPSVVSGDEGVLETARGDLEVVGGGGGEQVARDGVAVGRGDEDRVAAHLDRLDAGKSLQRSDIGIRQGGPDGAPGHQRLDLGGGAVGDDLAVADQDDAVGVGVGLLEVVRREEHRAALLGVLADGRPEVAPPGDVHARGGLVEDEQLGVGQQRHREPQPLLLAARALAHPAVGDVGDAGPLQHLGHRTGVAEQAGGQPQRLLDGEVLEQAAGLHDRRDEPVADRVLRLHAVDRTLPVVGPGQARASCRWSWSCRRRSGPRKAMISPGRTVRSIPRTARTLPKLLVSPRSSMAATAVVPAAGRVCVCVMAPACRGPA